MADFFLFPVVAVERSSLEGRCFTAQLGSSESSEKKITNKLQYVL
jgi:hypothetical protein